MTIAAGRVSRRVLFSAGLGGAAYAALHRFGRSQLFFPVRYPAGNWSAQTSTGARDVWLNTADGVRIHGWWKPGVDSRAVTLFLHGNGGNLTHRIGHFQEIPAAGSDLLVIDYRGYGKSEGEPSESGLYRDADAAYDLVAKTGKQIVIHGESLGSAVAVELATRRPAAAVILEAPFTSVRAMANRRIPLLGGLIIGGFDTRSKIARLRAPLLIVHGERDSIVPPRFGRELFEAATCPKELWVVPGAGHNDILDAAGPEYRKRLKRFYSGL